jgi:hypothetical protein
MTEFLGITRGEIADRHGWLTRVPALAPMLPAPAAAS